VLGRLADCPPPEPLPVPAPAAPGRSGRGRHASRPEHTAVTPSVPGLPPAPDPVPTPGRRRATAPVERRDRADGPRWRRVLVATVVLGSLATAAVGVGIWWAGGDRPSAAALPVPDPMTITPTLGSTEAPTVAPTGPPPAAAEPAAAAETVDWATVVRELDARRAAAFAAADPALLQDVYTVTAPGLVEDAVRIRALADGGLHVEGLVHTVSAVERLPAADPHAAPRLAVTDALPAATVVDDAGTAVGTTDPVGDTRRVVTLATEGGGYRIASVTTAPE